MRKFGLLIIIGVTTSYRSRNMTRSKNLVPHPGILGQERWVGITTVYCMMTILVYHDHTEHKADSSEQCSKEKHLVFVQDITF